MAQTIAGRRLPEKALAVEDDTGRSTECGQPRPTKGIFVAINVTNCTFAYGGSEAMCTTVLAAYATSRVGSGTTSPFACLPPR